MPYISRQSRRIIAIYLFGVVLAFASNILQQKYSLSHISTIMYSFLVIFWGVSVYDRVLDRRMRGMLVGIAFLLLLLFMLRLCRWNLFNWSPDADRLLWYALYIPYTGVPLLGFFTVLCVGREQQAENRGTPRGLLCAWTGLCVVVMANDLHGWLLIRDYTTGKVTYEWLYFLVCIWCAGLVAGSIGVLLHRCSIFAVKRLWYVPFLFLLCGVFLVAVYYSRGGSPEIRGVKLYHIHEVIAALVISIWESCMQIGLIPSNTDYAGLFRIADLDAVILDIKGKEVYCSERETSAAGMAIREKVPHRASIRAGEFCWMEDVTEIRRLNRDIAESTELLKEENGLIREENRIHEEKAHYEERNLLYDQVSRATNSETKALRKHLDCSRDTKQDLIRTMILGAFIKRKANLMLLAAEKGRLSVYELWYAVREVLEYVSLSGISCFAEKPAAPETETDGALLLLGFSLLEDILQVKDFPYHALMVQFPAAESFCMNVILDTEIPMLPVSWRKSELEALRVSLHWEVADATGYYRLREERRALEE